MSQQTKHLDTAVFLRIFVGDEIAFRTAFHHYKAPFYATAYKMTRSATDAEEIVQEVFIALWTNRDKLASLHTPHAYLLQMLHNTIYGHFRKLMLEKKIKQHLFNQPAENEAENAIEQLLLSKEQRELMDRVISKMPPQQQVVYRLSKQEGLSRKEIAGKLRLSANTVRNHLQAAIRFLRNFA